MTVSPSSSSSLSWSSSHRDRQRSRAFPSLSLSLSPQGASLAIPTTTTTTCAADDHRALRASPKWPLAARSLSKAAAASFSFCSGGCSRHECGSAALTRREGERGFRHADWPPGPRLRATAVISGPRPNRNKQKWIYPRILYASLPRPFDRLIGPLPVGRRTGHTNLLCGLHMATPPPPPPREPRPSLAMAPAIAGLARSARLMPPAPMMPFTPRGLGPELELELRLVTNFVAGYSCQRSWGYTGPAILQPVLPCPAQPRCVTCTGHHSLSFLAHGHVAPQA